MVHITFGGSRNSNNINQKTQQMNNLKKIFSFTTMDT